MTTILVMLWGMQYGEGSGKRGLCVVLFVSLLLLNCTLGMQYGEGGSKWGRRRPRWLMVERTYLHGLWRASQAAHKAWATAECPSMGLMQIPVMHKVCCLTCT